MTSLIFLLDKKVTEVISERLESFRYFLKNVKFTANQSSYWIVVLFLWAVAKIDLLSILLLTLGIVILTGFLMILKLGIKRERPSSKTANLHVFDAYSFPSGHAARVSLIAAFAHFNGVAPFMEIFLLIWVFLVSLERVVSKEHYLLDTLAGILFGFTWGWLWSFTISNFG